jgi:hypothetical protein
LLLGPVHDEHERRADRAAGRVASQGTGRRAAQAGSVRRPAPEADRGGIIDDAVEQRIRQASTGGRSLPAPVRAGFERALGAGFGAVRVHADDEADRLTEALGARAFNTGQHIFFRRGEYDPGDRGGRALIAHELTHVADQHGGDADTVRRSLLGTAELKQQWMGYGPANELYIDHDNVDRDPFTGELMYAVPLIDDQPVTHPLYVRASLIKIAPAGRGLGGKLGFSHPIHGGPGRIADYEVPERLSRAAEDTFLNRAPAVGGAPVVVTLGRDNAGNAINASITPSDVTILNKTYNLLDYKGKPIIVPLESTMWQWYQARTIKSITVTGETDPDLTRRVVFGTKDDRYATYPEKFKFMNRRQIMQEPSWKTNKYDTRLQGFNPLRGTHKGKWTSGPGVDTQNRWDEINEESGLRVKHAPGIIMKNQFVRTYQDFLVNYMNGSQGTGGRARGGFVTSHEIYRMFSGKHRKQILDRTTFADQGQLDVHVSGKKKHHWYTKDQIARNYRIQWGK